MHGALYQAEADGRIDLAKYVGRIAELAAAAAPAGVRVDASLAPAECDSAIASALGVIVNEAAFNAFKHGFDGRAAGRLDVRGAADGEGYEVTVEDDGAGWDGQGAQGLGTGIMQASAAQVGAALAIGPGASGGCRVEVRVPAEAMARG